MEGSLGSAAAPAPAPPRPQAHAPRAPRPPARPAPALGGGRAALAGEQGEKGMLEAVVEEAVDEGVDAAVAVSKQLKVGRRDSVRMVRAVVSAQQQVDLSSSKQIYAVASRLEKQQEDMLQQVDLSTATSGYIQ